MFYFKSRSINDEHHSLIPFTEPVTLHIDGQGHDAVGKLMCHNFCIFRHNIHNIDNAKLRTLREQLKTLITYINESIENSIEEGEIEGIIDVENWKEDVFYA